MPFSAILELTAQMETTHGRDPRTLKHREAEKRHREKLADNLEFLKSVLPTVTSKVQKAEIYAEAASYIVYLRQFVPKDKWTPPISDPDTATPVGASGGSEEYDRKDGEDATARQHHPCPPSEPSREDESPAGGRKRKLVLVNSARSTGDGGRPGTSDSAIALAVDGVTASGVTGSPTGKLLYAAAPPAIFPHDALGELNAPITAAASTQRRRRKVAASDDLPRDRAAPATGAAWPGPSLEEVGPSAPSPPQRQMYYESAEPASAASGRARTSLETLAAAVALAEEGCGVPTEVRLDGTPAGGGLHFMSNVGGGTSGDKAHKHPAIVGGLPLGVQSGRSYNPGYGYPSPELTTYVYSSSEMAAANRTLSPHSDMSSVTARDLEGLGRLSLARPHRSHDPSLAPRVEGGGTAAHRPLNRSWSSSQSPRHSSHAHVRATVHLTSALTHTTVSASSTEERERGGLPGRGHSQGQFVPMHSHGMLSGPILRGMPSMGSEDPYLHAWSSHLPVSRSVASSDPVTHLSRTHSVATAGAETIPASGVYLQGAYGGSAGSPLPALPRLVGAGLGDSSVLHSSGGSAGSGGRDGVPLRSTKFGRMVAESYDPVGGEGVGAGIEESRITNFGSASARGSVTTAITPRAPGSMLPNFQQLFGFSLVRHTPLSSSAAEHVTPPYYQYGAEGSDVQSARRS